MAMKTRQTMTIITLVVAVILVVVLLAGMYARNLASRAYDEGYLDALGEAETL